MTLDTHSIRSAALLLILAMLGTAGGCDGRASRRPQGTATPRAATGVTPLQFSERGVESGIDFIPDGDFGTPMNILEVTGYGAGFVDYDSDGYPDILLMGRPHCRLYRNLGDGTFEDVTRAAGLLLTGHWMGCASGDFDRDGRPDLLLTGYRAAALFRNTGGHFERLQIELPPGLWSTSAAFLDYDRDGWLDLYLGAYVAIGGKSPRLCPTSAVGVSASCPPTHYDAQRGRLLRNIGGRRFVDTTEAMGLSRSHGKTLGVAVSDVDANGWPDLYLANDGMPCDLFMNQKGKFVERGLEAGVALDRSGLEQAGMGTDWGDVDGDGRLDLVVTTFQSDPTSLYLNQGSTHFREDAQRLGIGDATVNTLGFGIRFADVDLDGRLDLFIANGHVQDVVQKIDASVSFQQPCQLFQSNGETFVEADSKGTGVLRDPIVGRAVAAADYDRDGDIDFLVSNLIGRPRLFRNDTRTANHWISVEVRGRRSPPDGTGARVRLTAGGVSQVREVGSGGSYLACHDPRVLFGIGTARQVDAVEITWPTGRRERWRPTAVNKTLRCIEGSGEPLGIAVSETRRGN